jgi:hypothetical protein
MEYQFLEGLAAVAQNSDLAARELAVGRLVLLMVLLIVVGTSVVQASMFYIFQKAKINGWLAFVPGYNLWRAFQMLGWSGRSSLWAYVPVVSLVLGILFCRRLAVCFGKPAGFGWALLFGSIVAFPMLAFGRAEYRTPQSLKP